jgi:hypothetical protein
MKWIQDLTDMMISLANCSDGPDSPAARDACILAGAIREAKKLCDRAEEAERERDLAVAHDRQPYPAAHAYEKACEALERWKGRAAPAREAPKKWATCPRCPVGGGVLVELPSGVTGFRCIKCGYTSHKELDATPADEGGER